MQRLAETVASKKDARWFTLVELIVSISIVAIISTLGFVSFTGYVTDGSDFKRISDVALAKSQLEIYKKNHGMLYPTGSGYTAIMTGAQTVAQQYLLDEKVANQLDIVKVPLDPKTKRPYLYSVANDRSSYQIAATLENRGNLSASVLAPTAYAESVAGYAAYVNGTFIPTNKLSLPGLLYAVSPGAKFVPGSPLTFSLNTSSGVARAILNGQNVNLPYDMAGNMVANNGSNNLAALLAATPLLEKASAPGSGTNCPGIQNPSTSYFGGENEVWPYMAGTTIGSQIGWKYKTCNGDTGNMSPNNLTASPTDWNYVCASIPGAVFDSSCNWTGCQSGYTAVTSGGSAPSCKADLLAPTLAYPQPGAYGLPVDGTLAWNPVAGSNGTYTVYLWTTASPTAVYYSGSSLSATYSSFTKGTTYYWKVKTCDSGTPQQCSTSTVSSFTTVADAGSGGGSSSGGGTPAPVNDFCPTEPDVPCQVLSTELAVSYVGCSSNTAQSAYNDCSSVQNSFGTSERDGSNYYGVWKVIAYKIANTSNGSAYFRMKVGPTLASLVEKPMATGFDVDQAYDLGGEGIANNIYWKGISGCYSMPDGSYKILGQSTCWINIYGRSDVAWPTTLGNVMAFQVINADTINGFWTHAGINVTGKAALYSSPVLTATYSAASKQTLEPAAVGSADNFGTSTRIGTGGTYGYWKSLTYTIANPDTKTAFFRVFLSGEGLMTDADALVKPTADGANPDTASTFVAASNPGAVYDLGGNGVGNVVWENGTTANATPCPVSFPGAGGFSVPASGNCKITLYLRGDESFPDSSQNVLGLTLRDQTKSGYSYVPKMIKAIGEGWTYSFNQYVWSENLGWIKLSVQTVGTTVRGYAESENFGWICFGTSCGANITRDSVTGKLQGYAYSEMFGWINVDNVYLRNDLSASGYLQSENLGWIGF